MASSGSSAWKAPSAGALVLHAAITSLALAIGLASCQTRVGTTAPPLMAGPADLEPAREDLAAARHALDEVKARVAAAAPRGAPTGSARPTALESLVPQADDPPVAWDRFAKRLVEMETGSRAKRTLQYYDMMTRPLLKGFDDATIERITQAFATYVTATKSIPWGMLGGQQGGSAESWRQVLEDQDRVLREKLDQDLPPETVELLRTRFAMRVPGPGEPLPTPKLGGTEPKER